MLAVSALGDGLLFLIRLHNCLVSFSVALLSSLDLALAIRSPISRDRVSASTVRPRRLSLFRFFSNSFMCGVMYGGSWFLKVTTR